MGYGRIFDGQGLVLLKLSEFNKVNLENRDLLLPLQMKSRSRFVVEDDVDIFIINYWAWNIFAF